MCVCGGGEGGWGEGRGDGGWGEGRRGLKPSPDLIDILPFLVSVHDLFSRLAEPLHPLQDSDNANKQHFLMWYD